MNQSSSKNNTTGSSNGYFDGSSGRSNQLSLKNNTTESSNKSSNESTVPYKSKYGYDFNDSKTEHLRFLDDAKSDSKKGPIIPIMSYSGPAVVTSSCPCFSSSSHCELTSGSERTTPR